MGCGGIGLEFLNNYLNAIQSLNGVIYSFSLRNVPTFQQGTPGLKEQIVKLYDTLI